MKPKYYFFVLFTAISMLLVFNQKNVFSEQSNLSSNSQFMLSVIDSLYYYNLTNIQETKDLAVNVQLNINVHMKISNRYLEKAFDELSKYQDNDNPYNLYARQLLEFYQKRIKLNNQITTVFNNFFNSPFIDEETDIDNVVELNIKSNEFIKDMKALNRKLIPSVMGCLSAIVGTISTADGNRKIESLNITDNEKAFLKKKLIEHFGTEVKTGPQESQNISFFTAAYIYDTLNIKTFDKTPESDVPKAQRVQEIANENPDYSKFPSYEVTRIIDGDTVELNMDGKPTKVRLIGVNTPETKDPRKPVEFFGKEASAFTKSLLEGQSVYVEYEGPKPTFGYFKRPLVYLYRVSDGLFINREIIRQGYGFAYIKYPFRRMEMFRSAQKEARLKEKGLWNPDLAVPSKTEQKVSSSKSPQVQQKELVVYVTRSGKKYHRENCRFLKKSKSQMSLVKAKQLYSPCKVCKPSL